MRQMLTTAVGFLFLSVALFAQAPSSAPLPPPMQLPDVRADVKATSAAQLAYAQQLLRAVPETVPDSPARFAALAKVVTALSSIERVWPNDDAAIIQAALVEANLFGTQRAFNNVLQSVDRVLPRATGRPEESALWLARADAAHALGRTTEAEDGFQHAATAARRTKNTDELRVILRKSAAFHGENGAAKKASEEFREAAKLSKSAVARASCYAAAYQVDLKLDAALAAGDLDEIEAALAEADQHGHSASEQQYINHTRDWVRHARGKSAEHKH
jgi:tetratricopeptide (TPR) repeat protein